MSTVSWPSPAFLPLLAEAQMAIKPCQLAIALLASTSFPPEVNAVKFTVSMSLTSRSSARFQLEQERMRREQAVSAANLAEHVSVETAYEILQHNHKAPPEVFEVVEGRFRSRQELQAPHLRKRRRYSLAQRFEPSADLVLARDMLNDMLGNVSRNYDQQTSECSMFFEKQCLLLETCRQDISSANSEAAEWRSKVLAAQNEINICEIRIPRLKEEIESSALECHQRLGRLRRDLNAVLSDLGVMAEVLALAECQASGVFMQVDKVHLLKCKRHCAEAPYFSFAQRKLRRKLDRLQAPHTRRLVQQSLRELDEQTPRDQGTPEAPQPRVSRVLPLLQRALPASSCRGGGHRASRRSDRCIIGSDPQCQHLQNKFLSIEAGIADRRSELLQEIHELEASSERTKKTLEAEIETFEIKLNSENTKLAEATAGENTAAEEGKMKAQEHEELEVQMHQTRSSCSQKMRAFESEMCALKKIRGELFRMRGDAYPFFQDCQVTDWQPEDCSSSCGGGVQQLRRGVVVPASGGGVACPPLTMERSCNEHTCPVDCELSAWSGFSACSAECGGGVRERTRMVKVHAKYEGEPCGAITEVMPCGMQACDRDCVLGDWSGWSSCSKECNTGNEARHRHVLEPATGRGKCHAADSRERLQRKPCNVQPCPKHPTQALRCMSKVDLVLLLDGSGSLDTEGWEMTKEFAEKFVESFDGEDMEAQVAVILFSGPKSLGDFNACTGSSPASPDMEKQCGMKLVQHLSSNMAATKDAIALLQWPMSTALTSVALEMAKAELNLGRRDAEHVVLVITDGRPLSPFATAVAARELKKHARLMFGAVRLGQSNLQQIQEWATQPAEENVLSIPTFEFLKSISTIDAMIANICPRVAAPTLTS